MGVNKKGRETAMAVTDHGFNPQGHTPVSEELVRQHEAGWHAFTRFLTLATAGVIIVLAFLAIFLA